MTDKPDLSIVVGVQRAGENVAAILDVLQWDAEGQVEVLLCYARDDPVAARHAGRPGVRLIEGSADALIPDLWRDGILESRADRVALLTAHFIPARDWLNTALSLDMDSHVAYGGVIENDPANDGVGAAIHVLRYARFTPPQPARDVAEIAADNAVYRRADIMACEDLLAAGFWEPSYHARFRANGCRMTIHPELVAIHVNRYRPGDFARQRRHHGRMFGYERAAGAGMLVRTVMLLASPAAFLVLAGKITRQCLARQGLRRMYWRALPWLVVFLANWTYGECLGYADAFRGRSPRSAVDNGSSSSDP